MNLPVVKVDPRFAELLPEYRIVTFYAPVEVTASSAEIKAAMDELAAKISSEVPLEGINKIPAIAATRRAYKLCGKDPNRYRPSQEQLMRRVVRGLGLYTVNNIVDLGNILSLSTGCSVGCFDLDKIEGETITVGIGRAGEPYEGIGRGPINIEGMPVLRDAEGAFATPTSDSPRTAIAPDTSHLFTTIHLYDPTIDPAHILTTAARLFPITTSHIYNIKGEL